MEVLAVASTVCALCISTAAWIDQQEQKESLLSPIGSSVRQIHNILLPFSSAEYKGTGEAQLSDSIGSIGDALQRTKEHLVVWNCKRSQKFVAFLNPHALVAQLKDDERQLNHQLIILLTSIAVVGYFRDHAKNGISTGAPLLMNTPRLQDGVVKDPFGPLEQLVDVDAREFWRDYIGAKVEFVSNDVFCARLISWNTAIPYGTTDRILMRLDEYDSGVITPHNLSRVLGKLSLKEFVKRYSRGEKPAALDKSLIQVSPGHELRTPLLVWIDDRPDNNAYEVAQARALGIYVIEMASTAIAKVWVDANLAFLRNNDRASRVRFISDNVRLETTPGAGTYLNPTGGETFLRYLRGRFIASPVLIYTGKSILSTRYVESYEAAGSTTSPRKVLMYIVNLADGKDNDAEWRGFHTGS